MAFGFQESENQRFRDDLPFNGDGVGYKMPNEICSLRCPLGVGDHRFLRGFLLVIHGELMNQLYMSSLVLYIYIYIIAQQNNIYTYIYHN